MKHKCTRCGDVVEFVESRDKPLKSKGYTGSMIMFSLVIGLCLGIILCVALSEIQGSDCISNETLMNQTNQAINYGFNQGIIQSANYTTMTGNFSYIYENRMLNQNIFEYCNNLNNMEAQK